MNRLRSVRRWVSPRCHPFLFQSGLTTVFLGSGSGHRASARWPAQRGSLNMNLALYDIRVQNHLEGSHWSHWFEGLSVVLDGDGTSAFRDRRRPGRVPWASGQSPRSGIDLGVRPAARPRVRGRRRIEIDAGGEVVSIGYQPRGTTEGYGAPQQAGGADNPSAASQHAYWGPLGRWHL